MNQNHPASDGPDEALANATGLQVRKYYIEQKTASMGRKYHPNPKWDTADFWTEIGSICIRLDARPDLYVLAQFEFSDKADGPFPNALKGKGAMTRFIKWIREHRPKEHRPSSVDMSVDTDEVTAVLRDALRGSQRLFPGEPMRVAFASHMLMIPAWLRILMFPEDEEILQEFGETGAEELLKNPLLQTQCSAVDLPVARTLRMLLDRYTHLSRF